MKCIYMAIALASTILPSWAVAESIAPGEKHKTQLTWKDLGFDGFPEGLPPLQSRVVRSHITSMTAKQVSPATTRVTGNQATSVRLAIRCCLEGFYSYDPQSITLKFASVDLQASILSVGLR